MTYASRALTKTEKEYAHIEKELLAIVYAAERFDQYTYGRIVTVQTDHRPLEMITRKTIASCTSTTAENVDASTALPNW